MKEIGGYFALELNVFNNMPNADGILLNTGRNALEYVLRSIPSIATLYIPYFTCDVVLEPLKKLGINFAFYHINEMLEISSVLSLKADEYILYTNYFGIKDKYVSQLDSEYGDKLIVDNAQALYARPTSKCVFSPRKFVGIPDGGIAFTNIQLADHIVNKDESYERCSHLLMRIDQSASIGYSEFRENSKKLRNQPIKSTSSLTKALISNVDFDDCKQKRLRNFEYLHQSLKSSNLLAIPKLGDIACPMVYPYWVENGKMLKKKLIDHKIFVATYWPNVLEWCDDSMLERTLTDDIIPIPIDQRYVLADMQYILDKM